MNLYDFLTSKKANNEILDFDKITKEELQTLFYDESKPDSIIASLFNVETLAVTKKRKEMGIRLRDLILKDSIGKGIKELKEKHKKEIIMIEISIKNDEEIAAAELKKVLIHKIAKIDDVAFLDALDTILDSITYSNSRLFTSEQ